MSPLKRDEVLKDQTVTPSLENLETRWSQRWQLKGTYAFDHTAQRDAVFSIDTPPADGLRLVACRSCLQLYPHRYHRSIPAHAR